MNKKNIIKEELKNSHFRVSIFGSARIKKSEKQYKEAYNLAYNLASEGIDVITGGGPGIMEAANRGHKNGRKDNKTHSIGLNITLPLEQKANKNLDIEKTFKKFSNRLDYFMILSHAIVVSEGGIGTLLELFYSLQLIQVKKICNIPIILMGDIWPGLIKWLEKSPLEKKYFKKHDLNHLLIAKDHKEALRMLNKAYMGYNKKGFNVCKNSKKYKLK